LNRMSVSPGIVLLVGLLLSVGCRSSAVEGLAPVTGKVTLDGKPLPGVVVRFDPIGEGNSSLGKTDDQGRYKLRFSASSDGAFIGEHTVRIVNEIDDSNGKSTGPTIPEKYQSNSELTATVKSGSNTIDFDLESS